MSGISIIIVNYNVKYFLRQCLQSIYSSDFGGDIELIVIDNNSSDGSVEMLKADFPQVNLTDNKENLGFGRANNQGIQLAAQPYILILNPDTVLQEDTLSLCYDYMQEHAEAGALGVKMVDGSGNYLPESKRGFPTPLSSLFKLSRLSKIFPRSKFFNSYYQGHLPEDQINNIEVLTGAFMFMRTGVLKSIGGFDEDYFMYGEDIELSKQVYDNGHKIVYFPDTQIIHFKGESTKKLSASYVKNFYGAMSIYAKKRNKSSSAIWSMFLNIGIVISACVGILNKLTYKIIRPIIDVVILFFTANLAMSIWANFYFNDPEYFNEASSGKIYLLLVAVVVFCYYIFGQYDQRHNIKHLLYGFCISTLAALSLYSLFPSQLRFSRTVLLLMVITAPVILYFSRRLYNFFFSGTHKFNVAEGSRVAIVGGLESYDKIGQIVERFSGRESLVGRVSTKLDASSLGPLQNLKEIVESRRINEVIFCSSDMRIEDIFRSMATLGNAVSFKLANNNNTTILGSTSKERVGEWYALDISFKIDEPFHKRTKRILDLVFSSIALVLFPIVGLLSAERKKIYSNIVAVILGKKTWVSYNQEDSRLNELPQIKSGVFSQDRNSATNLSLHQDNLWYARNYSTWTELSTIFTKFFK